MEHTPGPWTVKSDVTHGWIVYRTDSEAGRRMAEEDMGTSDEEGGVIGTSEWSWLPNEADARLIAAAPELLETLRKFLAAEVWSADFLDDYASDVRAAIAKATGQDNRG